MTKRKRPEDFKPNGRPSKYNQVLAQEICKKVATNACGLNKLCQLNPDFPNPDTIYEWRQVYPEFSELYAQAKRHQADLLAEEILDISDDSSNDYCEDAEGNEKFRAEHVQRSRLRVDTRKWIACKLLPKVYGDKVQNEVTVINHEEALRSLK